MGESPAARKHFLLVLHDIAPETWQDYRDFVDQMDELCQERLGHPCPITWLVVPDFHHRNPLENAPEFIALLEARRQQGDELALHGFHHCDDAPPPRTPRDYVMRRVLTWEGEFYPLDESEARRRLQEGAALFKRLGWPLSGFVAPAWLMSDGTRRALQALDFQYTSDPQHLYRLPDFTPIDAPGLVWSARSAPRRAMSRWVTERKMARERDADVLRLGLHPVDMRHTGSRDYWARLVTRLLDDGYLPMTKLDWLTHKGLLTADRRNADSAA
ncbi:MULTISPECIES: DUF2334 domain-containing protein [Cobetia]|uniref:DUF2334 domain-containing protein n=1 Tax=Cobetia TaxID=204286 RepID=UPI000985D346|nr:MULTISPECIES: polysaccharide deacetylase family protein [Cobetia]MDA5563136.1 polysaccharide deacetylase family protein [Cobetia sp. MMG027]POR05051.1 DUF2334 domain-containing protein [Cobetia sp. MM1IDA2H-1]